MTRVWEEGTALRLRGQGLPSPVRAGRLGDLYVVVLSRPDPRFRRRGADLWRTETIDVAQAALGTELTVPAMEGTLTVGVPAGTQPGAILRLRGRGLPLFGDRTRGDLLVSIDVHVPTRLSAEQRRLYEQLAGLEREGATAADGQQASGTASAVRSGNPSDSRPVDAAG